MRPRLSALENTTWRNQLACLLLRVIAELAPCTPASLIACVAGNPPSGCGHSDSSTRRLVFDTLLTLEIQDLVRTDQDQISITDKGRRYLDQWLAQDLPPPAPDSVHLRMRAALLCAGELRRVHQLWLVAYSVATPGVLRMRRRLHALCQSAAALQKWQLNVSPMIASRTKTLVGAMTQRCLMQARAALEFLRKRAVTLRQTYTMAARLTHATLAACDRRAVVGAVVVLALFVTHGIASLSGKPTENVGGAWLLDGPNHADSTVETAGSVLVALTEPAEAIATNDIDETPPEMAFPERRSIEQQDGPGAAPSIVEQPAPDPIVVIIRSKLADPALHERVPAKDLAALQSVYAELGLPHWVAGTGLSTMAQDVINEIRAADDWGLPAGAFDLPSAGELPATPEDQATDEIKLSMAVLKYARLARGGRIPLTGFGKLIFQRPDLRDPHTTLTEIAASSDPAAYLRSLHPKHEQFGRLRKALIKARTEAKTRTPDDQHAVQRLIVNMERWRWMPAELGSYYVWNNIPAFTVGVMKNGQSIYAERTVVGQVKYPTPVFSAHMRSIVFNPKWVVPDTIKLEDLQPRLRYRGIFGQPDISVLRQYQLSVSYQGQPVDVSTVDWDRANIHQYTFTQPPGPNNVLGKLKFNFPNRHAIYMHDTLQTELFDDAVRAGSHGCIRVREPERLAALLLAEDKAWAEQQVKTMLATASDTVVALNRTVPVHLTYFTAVVDEQGKVQTFDDVYGIDDRMAQALFGEAAVKRDASSVASNIVKPERDSWRPVERVGGLTADAISGLFGN
jgi:murein L,D-transpeptidase YcbB/YkuD